MPGVLDPPATDVPRWHEVIAEAELVEAGPVRIEVGPRDLAADGVSLERRLDAAGVPVRCLTTPDGSLPPVGETGERVAVLAHAD